METTLTQTKRPKATVKGRLTRQKSLSERLEPGETIVTWKLPESLKAMIDAEAEAERRGINGQAIVILERYFASKEPAQVAA